MDNNNSNKTSNFFKKEGFYVILFLCICIAATIAAVSVKNSKNVTPKTKTVSEENISKEVAENTEEKTQEKRVDYSNAQLVNNNTNDAKKVEDAKKAVGVVKDEKVSSKAVASTVDVKFAKPVEGNLARDYSIDPVYWNSTNSHRAHPGIDIKTKLGTPVFSAMDGIVEKIETNTEDGVKITLKHQNGLKTIYSNLDPKVVVEAGKPVGKNVQIGNVGRSTLRAAYEEYGDHLHFEVLSGKESINPEKYIKYEK